MEKTHVPGNCLNRQQPQHNDRYNFFRLNGVVIAYFLSLLLVRTHKIHLNVITQSQRLRKRLLFIKLLFQLKLNTIENIF